jgi:hypothetical protein
MKVSDPRLDNWRNRFRIQNHSSYESAGYATLTTLRSGITTKQAVILEEIISTKTSLTEGSISDSSSSDSMASESGNDSPKLADSKDLDRESLEAETIGSNGSIIFKPATKDSTSEDTVIPEKAIEPELSEATEHESQLHDDQDASVVLHRTANDRPTTPEKQKMVGIKENE